MTAEIERLFFESKKQRMRHNKSTLVVRNEVHYHSAGCKRTEECLDSLIFLLLTNNRPEALEGWLSAA